MKHNNKSNLNNHKRETKTIICRYVKNVWKRGTTYIHKSKNEVTKRREICWIGMFRKRESSFFGVVERIRTEDAWEFLSSSSLWSLSILSISKNFTVATSTWIEVKGQSFLFSCRSCNARTVLSNPMLCKKQ